MSIDDIIASIREYIFSKQADIRSHQHLNEGPLLKYIRFAEDLAMNEQRDGSALFGYPALKTDFVPKDMSSVVIECKRIGFLNKKNRRRTNECDIKNGLAQVLEQAYCRGANTAILVVLDGGNAAMNPWKDKDKKFIQVFINNGLGINLIVLRARFMNDRDTVEFETIPGENQ